MIPFSKHPRNKNKSRKGGKTDYRKKAREIMLKSNENVGSQKIELRRSSRIGNRHGSAVDNGRDSDLEIINKNVQKQIKLFNVKDLRLTEWRSAPNCKYGEYIINPNSMTRNDMLKVLDHDDIDIKSLTQAHNDWMRSLGQSTVRSNPTKAELLIVYHFNICSIDLADGTDVACSGCKRYFHEDCIKSIGQTYSDDWRCWSCKTDDD